MWYIAVPDRRRGPRGGHHIGSLLELSGFTPLDLVFAQYRKPAQIGSLAKTGVSAWRAFDF
jgi:hypothetical protein